ncbi:DUF4270 domain-containing protein [Bacteroides sp. 51]|uniref:DUF4270 domain-containing protein n=1 Tax=Bacteroides sp. 51 TaxID=2302938 RepID=UPI0013D53A36|nr:DUF4270 domain-containing protein [Bacteroides sp. 51]NDV84582.1 DUF4270 domain-containing protein [Bacteroides sp. 51]
MNAKNLWLVLITLIFFGCDDNTGDLGIGMLPGEDEITVHSDKFDVKTQSAKFEDGKVYAKTDIGYVGRFTDNEYGFGYYEGSYLTELNCVDGLTFPKPYDETDNRNPINMISSDLDKSIISVDVILTYYDFFGDSITPMQVSVYRLNENLEKYFYTDIKPEEYYSKNDLLGKKTFSAADLSDSTRYTSSYVPTVRIPVPKEIGKEIIERNWNHPEDFENSETFRNFFKGLYVTSEMGSGTVLYVKFTDLEITYNGFNLDSLGNVLKKHNSDVDSMYVGSRSFASTMEVFQSNQIQIAEEEINIKVDETEHTYLKSPAGIYTKAVLPIDKIVDKLDLEKDTINAVKLVFDAYHHDKTNEYSMSAPQSVLLIREKEAEKFFEENKLPNSTTSYVTSISNNQYTFTNIMRLITTYIKEMEDAKAEAEKNGTGWNVNQWLEDNPVAIIPVYLDTTDSSINNVQHDMKPTYVKLKGGPDGPALDLQVIYTKYK